MDMVCPLCNGIQEIIDQCNICGSKMIDEGPLVNYLDDYSPYLSNDITQLVDGAPHDKCMHLFKCERCEKDKRIEIQRVRI
ncbi:hypothetical protein GOQ27_02040 [Clostridium sp. D2Q-11]|uniref:Uncharacterized protein n=1 Tax=Anaeromonas frigoriresistens TaxID=2683708 RepID=A0A942UUR4_9FIRM|nr:hypothetical protein [Anaeromonas frigoriresistens]MBS4537221.1 hypothetical protein [Anaeromonas frigoriresistens]